MRLDGQDSSKKIKQTIINVLKNDHNQYVQADPEYKKYANYTATMEEVLSRYTEIFKERVMRGVPESEIDQIVSSFMGFLQRKPELLETGKIEKIQK